jgi:hypothetical protein
VQGVQDLLDGCAGVEGVQLEQVEVIGVEPAQRRLNGADEPGPGRAGVLAAQGGGFLV